MKDFLHWLFHPLTAYWHFEDTVDLVEHECERGKQRHTYGIFRCCICDRTIRRRDWGSMD